MPYRASEARRDLRERVLPHLRAGSDPTPGISRPLLSSESSLEAPRVHLSLDGVAPSEEELWREFESAEEAFEAAIANLDPAAVIREPRGEVHLYRGEHAPELLLCAAFLKRLHEDVGARTLWVAIPERGLLLAVDPKRGREALEEALGEVERSYAEPLTSWVLRVERGALRGRAPLEPRQALGTPRLGSRPHALEPGPTEGLDAAPLPLPRPLSGARRPARDPEWMPKSTAGKLGLFVAALLALMVLGGLRGALSRPRQEITIPSPEALESIRGATAALDREVDRVQVTEEQGARGLELTLTSPFPSRAALLPLMERMRREARSRRGTTSLLRMRGRLTPAQAEGLDDLDGTARDLERELGGGIEVRFEVAEASSVGAR